MRKSLFTIDGFDAIFEGYTKGQHWNGWACPYFTKEVAGKIMQVNNKSHDFKAYQMRYDKEQDAFIRQEDEGDEPYVMKGIDIDGMHLYPIGNACWIWDDIAEYQSDQSKKLMEYLQEEYFWLNCEQLHDVYYGICQEIDGYMTDEQVKIFADGFMTAYGRNTKMIECYVGNYVTYKGCAVYKGYVAYKEFGKTKITSVENYEAVIRDASKVMTFDGTIHEAVAYIKQNMGGNKQ